MNPVHANHPIGLAAGVVPEFSPPQAVEAAAKGGFDMAGIWFDADDWTPQVGREVIRRLDANGIQAIDIEPMWIRPGELDANLFRLLDAGAEVGARNALLVSLDPDQAGNTAKMSELCEYAEPLGIRVCLEFGLFTEVKNLAMALAIVNNIGSPARGILIDALHLHRSGGTPAEVGAIPADLLPYAQLCDAVGQGPAADDAQGIIQEAVDGRLQVGKGELPLRDLLQNLPANLPLSIELRSKALRDGWPDPVERARVTAEATRNFLASLHGEE